MSAADTLLLSILARCQGNTLLVADENCLHFPFASAPATLQVLSNRIDVSRRASAAGLTCYFNDNDLLQATGDVILDHVVYRLAKEKPAVHHIANGAAQALAIGGTLWLVGGKQEGIKTFAKTLGKLLGDRPVINKEGTQYIVEIHKRSEPEALLDDVNYTELREIFSTGGIPVMSKPGQFGWNKIDKGSELLIAHLDRQLPTAGPRLTTLDLGCGYGYLGLLAAKRHNLALTATDNCAAALTACRENYHNHGISGEVIADDCGASIRCHFDLILCNPPFHQGFQQERAQTEKFLANTRRLLKTDGKALFVVNQFVGLEQLAKGHFRHIECFHQEAGFKLVALQC